MQYEYTGYAGIPRRCQGTPEEAARTLAETAQARVKGRMRRADVESYADAWAPVVAGLEIGQSATVEAHSVAFDVGINAGGRVRTELRITRLS